MRIAQNLKPFTGNGDVSKWVKNSRVGWKTPNKQTNQHMIGEVPNAYTQLTEETILSSCPCSCSVPPIKSWTSTSADMILVHATWYCQLYVSQHQRLLKYSTMYRLLCTERPTFLLFRSPVPSLHFCQGGFHHSLFTCVTSSLMKLTFCFYITSFSSLFASSSLHKFTSLFR